MPPKDKPQLTSEEVLLSSSASKPSETREVITREDGSKVVKVKKRKRVNENDTTKIVSGDHETFILKFFIKAFVVLVIVGIGLAAYYGVRLAYYNSPDHILPLQAAVSEKIGMQTTLKSYVVGPTQVRLDSIDLDSYEDAEFTYDITLRDVMVPLKFESILFKSLYGDEARAKKGSFRLLRQPGSVVREASEEVAASIPFSHEALKISEVEFSLGQGPRALKLSGGSAKIIKSEDGVAQLIFRDGVIKNLKVLPNRLLSAVVIDHPDHIEVKSLKLQNEQSSYINLSGDYYKGGQAESRLSSELRNMELGNLDQHFGKLVRGGADSSSGSLVIEDGDFSLQNQLDVSSTGIELRNFRFIRSLAIIFGDTDVDNILFKNVSRATLNISKEGYELSDLRILNRYKACVMGNFKVDMNGKLSGDLQVGIPLGRIVKAYPEMDHETLNLGEGFSWYDVKLSGTAYQPKDNFLEVFNETADALE